jgi:mannitol 2-dehydrogenase
VKSEIVHVGVGNFFRAHEAAYVHELIASDPVSPWRICGVGMLPSDRAVRDGLRKQNYTYNLVLKHPDGHCDRRVIRSLRHMLLATEDPWAVVARLSDPVTRIVSLTITEGGYNVDDATAEFDIAAPAVRADLQSGAAPTTVFAVVAHAMQRRRASGHPPFTLMSCDNIEGNGLVARAAFLTFARLLDPDLSSWMQDNVAFPSSMVDRITPATTDADRALLRAQWGVSDAVPVTCEPFTQWVLEDRFPSGRPPLETVGVQFVSDVRPYELMKLRLLNASHQALAYYGLLLGHEYVHDAAQDADLIELLRRYMDEEATPTLAPLPGLDLSDYKAMLLTRFANPLIADTLARLAAFSTDRVPKFLVPVMRQGLLDGRDIRLSAGVVASWLRYTEVLPDLVVDRRWDSRSASELLGDPALFGDLVHVGSFQEPVIHALEQLRATDTRSAIRALLS